MGGLLGGPKGMLAPPLKLFGGPGPPWPPLFLRLCIMFQGNRHSSSGEDFFYHMAAVLVM